MRPPDDVIAFEGAHLEGGHNYHFFNSTGGLLGHKRSMYEGGYRSPTMARWPGTIKPAVSDFPWAFWDVLPTLADLVGTAAPAGIDGISILPTLMGAANQQPEHEYLYWTWVGTGCEHGSCTAPTEGEGSGSMARAVSTYPPVGWQLEQNYDGKAILVNKATGETKLANDVAGAAGKGTAGYAIRMGDWKGVVPHCADKVTMHPSNMDVMEIYLLPSDPYETNNVNETAKGQAQRALFLAVAAKHNLTCDCYQC